jgi:hypothetical protein
MNASVANGDGAWITERSGLRHWTVYFKTGNGDRLKDREFKSAADAARRCGFLSGMQATPDLIDALGWALTRAEMYLDAANLLPSMELAKHRAVYELLLPMLV